MFMKELMLLASNVLDILIISRWITWNSLPLYSLMGYAWLGIADTQMRAPGACHTQEWSELEDAHPHFLSARLGTFWDLHSTFSWCDSERFLPPLSTDSFQQCTLCRGVDAVLVLGSPPPPVLPQITFKMSCLLPIVVWGCGFVGTTF